MAKTTTKRSAPYVVVRTYSAGVHVGTLANQSAHGRAAHLELEGREHPARDGAGGGREGQPSERPCGLDRPHGGDRGDHVRSGRPGRAGVRVVAGELTGYGYGSGYGSGYGDG